MQKSYFTNTEFSGSQKITFNDVISIEAFNNSECVAVIDKFTIEPGKRCFILTPDFSVCTVNVDLFFMPVPIITKVSGTTRPTLENATEFSQLPGIVPAKISKKLKQSVVFYVKSI